MLRQVLSQLSRSLLKKKHLFGFIIQFIALIINKLKKAKTNVLIKAHNLSKQSKIFIYFLFSKNLETSLQAR